MSIFSAHIAFLGLLLVSAGVSAAPQWWQAIYTSNSNNQINLKDENNTSVTAITNPTSANVKLNSNITTQPPTVIVQATASLPTAAIGSACTFGTSTAALSSSDRLTLLTCGSGNTWQVASRISLPVVTVGAACSITTDGNMAVDSAGLTLSCQSGTWKKTGGSALSISNSGQPGTYCESGYCNRGSGRGICYNDIVTIVDPWSGYGIVSYQAHPGYIFWNGTSYGTPGGPCGSGVLWLD